MWAPKRNRITPSAKRKAAAGLSTEGDGSGPAASDPEHDRGGDCSDDTFAPTASGSEADTVSLRLDGGADAGALSAAVVARPPPAATTTVVTFGCSPFDRVHVPWQIGHQVREAAQMRQL